MRKVIEAKTKNGRMFRVLIENNNQFERFKKTYSNNKGTEQEFISYRVVSNGIHNIKDFEVIAEALKNNKI